MGGFIHLQTTIYAMFARKRTNKNLFSFCQKEEEDCFFAIGVKVKYYVRISYVLHDKKNIIPPYINYSEGSYTHYFSPIPT
jgi:hypothetical protein